MTNTLTNISFASSLFFLNNNNTVSQLVNKCVPTQSHRVRSNTFFVRLQAVNNTFHWLNNCFKLQFCYLSINFSRDCKEYYTSSFYFGHLNYKQQKKKLKFTEDACTKLTHNVPAVMRTFTCKAVRIRTNDTVRRMMPLHHCPTCSWISSCCVNLIARGCIFYLMSNGKIITSWFSNRVSETVHKL